VAGSIPPLWLEIAALHFRGSFHNRAMWVPVVSLPLIVGGGAASLLIRDEKRSRAIFLPFTLLMSLVGAAGTFFHLLGVGRQMGGFRNWRYNVVTGPPFPAPLQVMLLGLLGAAASSQPARGEDRTLLGWVRAVDALSYVLLGVESGYNHWMGGYFNKVMFVPIVLSPALAATHIGALVRFRPARSLEGPLSIAAILSGLVGFGFHTWNVTKRRTGGFSPQNILYGAPIVAPLQLTGQGILGLLVVLFDD
jgi:hypothetical protein